MTVIKNGNKYGVYENGYQIAEYRNRKSANMFEQLGAENQATARAMYAHKKALRKTGLPTRGPRQRCIAAEYI